MSRRKLAVIWVAGAAAIAVVVWTLPPAYALPFAVFAASLSGLGAFLLLERGIRAQQRPAKAGTASDTRIHRRLEAIQTSIWGRKKQLVKVREQISRLERAQDRLAKQIAKTKPAAVPNTPVADPRTVESVRELTEAIERQTAELDRAAAEQAEIRALVESVGRLQSVELLRRDSGTELVPFERELEAVRSSPLFDADWYARRTGVDGDPALHYLTRGRLSCLDPHPLFAERWYGETDLASWERHRTGLGHYLEQDPAAAGSTHPAFAADWYRDAHLGADAEVSPIVHYLTEGARQGLSPSPLFDPHWYTQEYADLLPEDAEPFAHFLTEGEALGLRPNPAYDPDAMARFARPGAGSVFARVAAEYQAGPRTAADFDEARSEQLWKWHNVMSGVFAEPDTFALYRIIGNDLPPRHTAEQMLRNLRFMLDHEPELADCRKIWILNRVVDPRVERDIVDLLESRGAEYLRIPFKAEDYAKLGWNFRGFENQASFQRKFLAGLHPKALMRVQEHLYHYKNLYAMNNNGARNFALRHGRGIAKWVLPWDGNCFLTEAAWEGIRASVREQPHRRYLIVPMARLQSDNETLLDHLESIPADDEPQLAFRRDAGAEFDEDYRYGHRPKTELFRRLGIPGPWDRFPVFSWDPEQALDEDEQKAWTSGSKVYRLFSGNAELESNMGDRGRSRSIGIRSFIDGIDHRIMEAMHASSSLFCLDEQVLEEQHRAYRAGTPELSPAVAALIQAADDALRLPCPSVTDKTTVSPSGDMHDYWNPAPYWWPNPATADGLPYVRRDGKRVPGTHLGEPGSEQYDRTSLQNMIDRTFACALAGYFTERAEYWRHAASLVRTWFLDPATRMNPHLDYAQVRRGHDGNVGSASGIIETKDFYYLLDAIRLVERTGELSESEQAALREWFAEFGRWLEKSPQGSQERDALHNHGLWYDVQAAAVQSYLGDTAALAGTLRRGLERIGHQFDPSDGRQPAELQRTLTRHYTTYALSACLVLADFARRYGQDFVRFEHPRGTRLEHGIRWVLDLAGRPWPYQQIGAFDEDRLQVLAHWSAGLGIEDWDRFWVKDVGEIGQALSVHDGIRPFWLLGNANCWPTGESGDRVGVPEVVVREETLVSERPKAAAVGDQFLHVVATRHGIGIFDEDWFGYRQELFSRLTVPSMAAQTTDDFVWLVVVDRAMPKAAREVLDRMLEGHPTARVLEVELKIDFGTDLRRWAQAEAARRGVANVLTTRIDDDDVIHRDLIRRIQDQARAFLAEHPDGKAVITPTIGYWWVPSERRGYRTFHPSPSMGTSVIESASQVESVYSVAHDKIMRKFAAEGETVLQIGGRDPMWLYAITAIADQQGTDVDRRAKVLDNPAVERLSDELFDEFGIAAEDAEYLAGLVEPEPVDTTKYLTWRGKDVEREIRGLRKRLLALGHDSGASADEIAAQITELHRQRREMHENIVVWNR